MMGRWVGGDMKTRVRLCVLAAALLPVAALGAELNTLGALKVLPQRGGTQVVVTGNRAPTFTVFRMSDPDRLVVDLSTADAQAIKGHHDGNGSVDGVVVSQFSDTHASVGRVLVALRGAPQYDVRAEGNSVLITVTGGERPAAVASSPSAEPPAASTAAVPEQKPLAVAAAPTAHEATTPAATTPAAVAAAGQDGVVQVKTDEQTVARPGKLLKAVRSEKGRLRLVTDGPLVRFDVVELASPPRLAVDLFHVKSAARAFRVAHPSVREVRVGSHGEKVRLVFDVVGEMPAWEVERTARGLDMLLGPAALAWREARSKPAPQAKDESPASAPSQVAVAPSAPAEEHGEAEIDGRKVPVEPEQKPVPEQVKAVAETRPVQVAAASRPAPAARPERVADIKSIRFDEDEEGGRLQVKFSGSPTWEVERPDPRSVVLTFTGAQLPKSLERSLDTSALKTPVKMISTFTVPGGEKKVRVVVAAASALESSGDGISRTKDGLSWRLRVAAQQNEQAATAARTAGFASEPEIYAADASPRQSGKYTGQKVTFEFKDIDIHNLLRIIAEVSKKNIVVADDVTGRVTIRLRNVPWDQALDLVLRSKGLGKEVFGNNIIRVAPLGRLEEESKLREQREESRKKSEPLQVALVPVNYASATDMAARVKDILTDRGSVTVDSRTNVLVVRDVAASITKARTLVQSLDTQTPQVLIESRIVEANTTFTRQIGVQWGGNGQLATSTNNATGLIFPNTAAVAGGAGQAPNTGTAAVPNYAVNLPAAAGQGAGGALGFLFGSAGGAANLNLRLSALENQGAVKTISAPKVTTLDNVTAKISQGVSIPFSQASAQGVNTTFVEARLQLEVTPHITQDGSVMMNIKAENNQPDPSATGANGQPAIQRKEAQTQVLVKDGDTTVIGGIYVRTGSQSEAGIPFFSRIPILGFFFKTTTELETRQELLIFITPRIINRQAMQTL
jgi:type IV pilus assembly protein PilQ